jgi:protein TonB
MFATLLESRAIPQRRTGSSVTSVIAHTIMIGAAVVASAREIIPTPQPGPVGPHVVYRPTQLPQPRSTASATSDRGVSAAPTTSAFVVRIPNVVPVGIPPIDHSLPQTPVDFRPGAPLSSARCSVDCTTRSISDGSGRELWSTNELMMRLSEEPVPPRYPELLRRAGIEGSVVVRFIVDTTGRVDMRSVEVLRSTHEGFTAAVRETLERLRFRSNTRALAVMPFQFTLR